MGGQLNTLRALSQPPCGSHDPRVAAAAPSVTHHCDNKQRWQRGEGSAPRAPAKVNVPPTRAGHTPAPSQSLSKKMRGPGVAPTNRISPFRARPTSPKVLHSEQNKRSKAGVGGQPARSTVVTKESHPLSHCHKVPGERSKLQQRPPVCRQRTPKGAETGQTLAVKWLRFRRRWPK